jgi:protein TonB
MTAMIEARSGPSTGRVWALRLGIGAVVVALLVAAGVWLAGLSSKPQARERQVARIAILPDTPPPPPPPPPERPPEPKDTPKPAPQAEQPKPADEPKPAEQPLKMEGPAGDGPSAFQAGAVTQDYRGAPPGTTTTAAPAAARGQQRLYAMTARQQLRDAIERHYAGDASNLVAEFSVWVAPDGALQRVEVVPTGDAANDRDLRAALDLTLQSLRLSPPPAMEQPLRFRLSLRASG